MNQKWTMPKWMEKYAGTIIPDKQTCEWHMNDNKTNVLVNAPLAMDIVATKSQVQTIIKMHNLIAQPRPLEEWHEDVGDVIWWKFPIEEPPYCGNPLDSGWIDNYYTHWTPIVDPYEPSSE